MRDGVLELMQLGPTDVVADLGAGEGFYAQQFAQVAKKVYAIDANAEAVARAAAGQPNVVAVHKDLCRDFRAPDDLSHAFFSNSFHDLECREAVLDGLAAALPPGGRLTFVEFKLDTPFGPPRSIRIGKEDLRRLVEAHGFRLLAERDFTYHYALSFVREP